MRNIYIICTFLIMFLTQNTCQALDQKRDKVDSDQEVIYEAIQNDIFNVNLTRNIPKTSKEIITQYSGLGYIIRVRKDIANIYIPGVNNGGSMEFGTETDFNGNIELAEQVEASCEFKGQKGKIRTYVLKQLNRIPTDVTLKVSNNGNVKIIVERMPMTRFSYYGEVTLPDE